MRIIGCDLHARQQTLAMLDTDHRRGRERRLSKHEGHNVREFYSTLPRPVRVGIEATGSMQWFVKPAWKNSESNVWLVIRRRFEQPSHGSRNMIGVMRDFLLSLLVEERFPAIWLPTKELLDLRALFGTDISGSVCGSRIQNALLAIALGQRLATRCFSVERKQANNAIASLPLSPHAASRRNELQAMYVKFEDEIEKLNQRVEQQARERSAARLLMTHPGVGPITALATEVFLGDPIAICR